MTKHSFLLVGSIPLENAGTVFEAVADTVGDCLTCVPDGETGIRKTWIGWQHTAFKSQDALEPTTAKERDYQLNPPYRFKPGKSAADITFGSLGFAKEALQSYELLCRKRKDGAFTNTRFQVCLPTPFAPLYSFAAYEAQGDLYPLYEDAMLRELGEITDIIPPNDLVIQWDVATEMSIVERLHPVPFLGDDPVPWLLDRLGRLGDAVPADAGLGYHLCYGSMGNKHWKEPENLTNCVETANAIAQRVERPIDFVHMPVPIERDDDPYFAPLDKLSLAPGTEVYLGLIHLADRVDGARRRIQAAERHLPAFGLSTECGWGRMDPDDVMPLLELHTQI